MLLCPHPLVARVVRVAFAHPIHQGRTRWKVGSERQRQPCLLTSIASNSLRCTAMCILLSSSLALTPTSARPLADDEAPLPPPPLSFCSPLNTLWTVQHNLSACSLLSRAASEASGQACSASRGGLCCMSKSTSRRRRLSQRRTVPSRAALCTESTIGHGECGCGGLCPSRLGRAGWRETVRDNVFRQAGGGVEGRKEGRGLHVYVLRLDWMKAGG